MKIRYCDGQRLARWAFSGGPYQRCTAYRNRKGEFIDTCGEPCRWIMMKLGHGDPPWTEHDIAEELDKT